MSSVIQKSAAHNPVLGVGHGSLVREPPTELRARPPRASALATLATSAVDLPPRDALRARATPARQPAETPHRGDVRDRLRAMDYRRLMFRCLGWVGALLLVVWRFTLRIRIDANDPRPALKASGRNYVYAILHSQQLNFVLLSDDRPVAAMVSASRDGDALVPLMKIRKVIPVRGSTRKKGKDKGGQAALKTLIEGVKAGQRALLAVDGPRGPRNTVHRGVAYLASTTDACVVISGVFPSHRKILSKTWDRTQIPLPFSALHGRFRPSLDSRDFKGDIEGLRAAIADELLALEQEWDPEEAAHAVPFAIKRPKPAPPEALAEATEPSQPESPAPTEEPSPSDAPTGSEATSA